MNGEGFAFFRWASEYACAGVSHCHTCRAWWEKMQREANANLK